VSSKGAFDPGKASEAERDIGVAGRESLLSDGKSASVERGGRGVDAPSLVQGGKISERARDV